MASKRKVTTTVVAKAWLDMAVAVYSRVQGKTGSLACPEVSRALGQIMPENSLKQEQT